MKPRQGNRNTTKTPYSDLCINSGNMGIKSKNQIEMMKVVSESTGGIAPAPGCADADVSAGGAPTVPDCVPESSTSWLRVTARVGLLATVRKRAPGQKTTKLYQAMVGSLIFLTQCMSYDVAFGKMQSARHMAKPTSLHMGAVKRILRYLRGTPPLSVLFKRDNSFDQVGYCDAFYV